MGMLPWWLTETKLKSYEVTRIMLSFSVCHSNLSNAIMNIHNTTIECFQASTQNSIVKATYFETFHEDSVY